jgi:hypothetical protein
LNLQRLVIFKNWTTYLFLRIPYFLLLGNKKYKKEKCGKSEERTCLLYILHDKKETPKEIRARKKNS